MNRKLLQKYFHDQCTPEELEQVLDWFQTDEGRKLLKRDIQREKKKFDESEDLILDSEIETERVFARIQRHKRKGIKQKSKPNLNQSRWHIARVASVILVAAALSFGLFLTGVMTPQKKKQVPEFITYTTATNQQKVFKLSDRVKIWLNENSVLKVPIHFTGSRSVTLEGEAYFEVTHNAEHPFIVKANGAIIQDLGTRFVVSTDTASGAVQVAVIEGKVKLKKEGEKYQTSAILTRNHFGMLDLSSGQITIEKGNTSNYVSWITNKIEFHGVPLDQISRQLQRLYNVKIRFQSDRLKRIRLTATFEKTKLKTVLKLIAHTLDIHFKVNGQRVVWMN